MLKNQKIALLLFYAVVLIMLSCNKIKNSDIQAIQNDQSKNVFNYIKGLGYSESSIIDDGDRYVVEGDISFPKNMILRQDTGRQGSEEQFYNGVGNLVNTLHQVTVKVRVDASLAAQASEVNSAVNLWNNASAWLKFQVVTGGEDILIRNSTNPNFCGRGDFAANGLAGHFIDINMGMVAADNFNQRVSNIAHEMGHTIGFRHTNGDAGIGFGTPVPGWGGTDANSIMNGLMCHSLPTVLSYNDIQAVNALYRNPYPINPFIDINYGQFTVKWTAALPNPSDNLIGYDVTYSVQSGTSASGTAHLGPGAYQFIIPGVDSNAGSTPTGNSGYAGASVQAVYASGATYSVSAPSRSRVNGIWR